jgi:hypothetical protein
VTNPTPSEASLTALKSETFFHADYGSLGKLVIILPENNGGDEQFEADFEATLQFVRGVMVRRKEARSAASNSGGEG